MMNFISNIKVKLVIIRVTAKDSLNFKAHFHEFLLVLYLVKLRSFQHYLMQESFALDRLWFLRFRSISHKVNY
jgi:hypothetical protein